MDPSTVCIRQVERNMNQEILRYRNEMLKESSMSSLDLFNEMGCARKVKDVRMKKIMNNHIRDWNRE